MKKLRILRILDLECKFLHSWSSAAMSSSRHIRIAFDDDGSRAMGRSVDLPATGLDGLATRDPASPAASVGEAASVPSSIESSTGESGAGVDPTGSGVGMNSSAALHRFVVRARAGAWIAGYSKGEHGDIVNRECSGKDAFDEFYEVRDSAAFIVKGGYKKVALQMPDYLLPDGPRLVRSIYREINVSAPASPGVAGDKANHNDLQIFVLGDTSYGSCCVDEVNASHMGADSCIHYGHACLQPTASLPVKYVFGKLPLNVDGCAEALVRHAVKLAEEDSNETGDPNGGVLTMLVLHDVAYAHHASALQESIEVWCNSSSFREFQNRLNIMVARTDMQRAYYPVGSNMQHTDSPSNRDEKHRVDHRGGDFILFAGQQVPWSSLAASYNDPLQDNSRVDGEASSIVKREWVVVFVGSPGTRLTRVAMRYGSACRFVIYDPLKWQTNVNRTASNHSNFELSHSAEGQSSAVAMLTKRYYLVQRCRDASIIGIIVGTMAVGQYRAALDRVKEVIRKSGRKSYMFLIGKINAAKLLNFPEIDVFVLVACPENSLLDSKALFKPVVTPFELEMALCEGREWDGLYSADFRDLLEWNTEAQTYQNMPNRTAGTDGLVRPINLANEEDAADIGDGETNSENEEGDFYMSLVDGKLHSRRGHLFDKQHCEERSSGNGEDKNATAASLAIHDNSARKSESLALKGEDLLGRTKPTLEQALTAAPATDARDYMIRRREYNGLEVRLGMDKPMAATEGMSGIAWSYEGEGKPSDGNIRATTSESAAMDYRGESKLQIEDVDKGSNVAKVASVGFTSEISSAADEQNVDAIDSSEEEEGPEGGAFGLFDNLTSSSDDDDDEEESGGGEEV